MENKQRYFRALMDNKGKLNEIDLGEKLGFDENETNQIISQLLSEHKIEYAENKASNYRKIRTSKRLNK